VSDTPPAPSGDGGPGDGGTARSFSGGSPLNGNVVVPGDKSISHRAILLAALAEGESTITGLSTGDDVARTLQAIEALGAGVTSVGGTVTVRGGRSGLHAPDGPIDLGNSGTGMRLLAGVVATLAGTTVLTGDDSLRGRPMDRVAGPLRLMGATVGGQGERCLPPVTIGGGDLHGIEYTPPMASAQVKSAILLAGLAAGGETVVHEPVATRPHTEDMLAAAGAEIDVEWDSGAKVIRVRRSDLACGAYTVPGDPSQAAFWTVAATIILGSLVTVEGIALSPERLGFVGLLRRMGASIEVDEHDDGTGSVTGYTCALHGTDVEASEIPSLDEVPILAVAAATALGTTRFRDVGELRVKESDRLAGTADLVRAFGGRATVDGDELVVEGTGSPLRPARIDALGDHRMAMAAAVAGAACAVGSGPTVVDGWDAVDTSYPGFAEELDRLRAPGTVQW
jgi:3-phosphoshikimate 1-carboxyvinyltransferase